MLAPGIPKSTEVDHLINDVGSAVRKAYAAGYAAGWRAAAKASADLLNELPLDDTPYDESPQEDDNDFAIEESETPENSPAPAGQPTPGSYPDLLLGILKEHPTGLTTHEIVKAVRDTGRQNIGRAVIRTTLHRLRTNSKLVDARYGKWFPVGNADKGNAGAQPPAQRNEGE